MHRNRPLADRQNDNSSRTHTCVYLGELKLCSDVAKTDLRGNATVDNCRCSGAIPPVIQNQVAFDAFARFATCTSVTDMSRLTEYGTVSLQASLLFLFVNIVNGTPSTAAVRRSYKIPCMDIADVDETEEWSFVSFIIPYYVAMFWLRLIREDALLPQEYLLKEL